MESFPDTLRDIHGLDTVPWWPPAPGVWIAIGSIVLLVLAVGLSYLIARYGPWSGWRSDARRQLRALRKAVSREDSREVAARLSELLRRIAMARSGRRAAAGLAGETWLHWLAEQDTSGFDWVKRGQMLLEAPYMPPAMEVKRRDLITLIRAANRWIDATKPSRKGMGIRTRASALVTGLIDKDGSARV
jgi:hypothetical protein